MSKRESFVSLSQIAVIPVIAAIAALAGHNSFASCGKQYEKAIASLEPLVKKQQEIARKKDDVGMVGLGIGFSAGLSTIPGLPVEGSMTGVMVGTSTGATTGDVLYPDLENDPIGQSADRKASLEILREAYVGGGELIYDLLQDALNGLNSGVDKNKLSAASISLTIVDLDGKDAFCASSLDSSNRMRARILSNLK